MTNKKEPSCTFVGIGMLVAGFGLAAVTTGLFDLREFTTIFLATIVAAFAGTYFAFLIQNKREDRIIRNNDIKLAHNLELCLYGQYMALETTYKSYLEQYENDPFRYYNIPNPSTVEFSSFVFDMEMLSIFTHTDHRSLIKHVIKSDLNARVSIKNFNLRADYCRDVVSPQFNTLNIDDWVWTEEYIAEALGTEIHEKLTRLTDNVYHDFSLSRPIYRKLRYMVYEALSELYPDQAFMNPKEDRY